MTRKIELLNVIEDGVHGRHKEQGQQCRCKQAADQDDAGGLQQF